MDTVLLTDALDQPIHAGDCVIDESGKAFFVGHTENSFIRQGVLRVYEARLRRKQWHQADTHTYLMPHFSVKVPIAEVPTDALERRLLYREKVEPNKAAKSDELRLRRSFVRNHG